MRIRSFLPPILITVLFFQSSTQINYYDCQYGCYKCSYFATECYECSSGYGKRLPNFSYCDKCPKGCKACSGVNLTCKQCESGYYPKYYQGQGTENQNQNTQQLMNCEECIKGCSKCENNFNCIDCQFNYDITADKKCKMNVIKTILMFIFFGIIIILGAAFLIFCYCTR